VPEDGPWSIFGREARLGAALALSAFVGDLALASYDETASDLVDRLAAAPPPRAVIGHLFEDSLAAASPVYLQSRTPVLLPFLDNPDLASLGPGFFRLLPDPAGQGLRLAQEVPRGGQRLREIFILEGPDPSSKQAAEAFRQHLIDPQAPPPTPRNPKPSKPRAISAKKITTVPIEGPEDLKIIGELKGTPQDHVLLALPLRLALRAAPALARSKLKRATLLAPTWLAVRELGAAYLALDLNGLFVLVPGDVGTPKSRSRAWDAMSERYLQRWRLDPTWVAGAAYDAVALAALAAASEDGPAAYLSDPELTRLRPSTAVRVDSGRLPLLP
jgi:ABC-type branched-subunit amino acid transport system substrate-binding protein